MVLKLQLLLEIMEVKKGKGAPEPKAQTAGAYPGYLRMRHA